MSFDDLTLRHYSAEPVLSVESRAQSPYPAMKPAGLWLSVDSCEDNWRAWCEGEQFGLDRLFIAHDVNLRTSAKILRLSGSSDILSFTKQYRVPEYPGRTYALDYHAIAWDRVAAEWQGLIITPYVWTMRLDHRTCWYYGWDCASGCVWDAGAIESVTVAEEALTPRGSEGG